MGATGSTGSAVLHSLLAKPPLDLKLHILVRSKTKLLAAFPDIEKTEAFNIRIIEGNSTDGAALQRALDGAVIAFMCVADNYSKPGLSIVADTAVAMIDTLKILRLRRGDMYRPVTIVQLRSASLNPPLRAQVPGFVSSIVWFCLHYIYTDLMQACYIYQKTATDAPGLLDYIFIDPPTLHDTTGTVPTGYELISTEKQRTALSFADLGAAFCEVAMRKGEFRRRAVGVTALGKVNEHWSTLLGYLVIGGRNRVLGLLGLM